MGLNEAVRSCFQKYAVFSGRATRSEFWFFYLFLILISIILGFFNAIAPEGLVTVIGMLSGLFSLITLLPSLAVSVRRLHDIDRSGWWLLIWFVPIIGWIILLIFFLTPSK